MLPICDTSLFHVASKVIYLETPAMTYPIQPPSNPAVSMAESSGDVNKALGHAGLRRFAGISHSEEGIPTSAKTYRVRRVNIRCQQVVLFDGYWDEADLLAWVVPP